MRSQNRTASASDPGSAEAHYRLGEVLAGRGEYVPSLDALIAAAELDKRLAGPSES